MPPLGWYLAQDDGSTFVLGSAFVVRMFNHEQPLLSQSSCPHQLTTRGTWYHLVLTYDGTTASLYTNGVLRCSGTPTQRGRTGLRGEP